MQTNNSTQAHNKKSNAAAKTISWFMHGTKFRLIGNEQTRV